MSPEQANGAPGIDGRTDVFAFGSILFESLTAQRAYDGPNFNALIVTIATKEPASIDTVAPHLPEGLRALVRECLVTDKEKRLASFDLVLERLAKLMPELEASGLRLPIPPSRPSEPSRTPPVVRPRSDPPPKLTTSNSQPPPGGPNAAVPLAMHITNPPPPLEKPVPAHIPLMQTMIYDRGLSGRAVGAAVLVVALVVGVAAAFTRVSQSSTSNAATSAGAASAASALPGTPQALPGGPSEATSAPVVPVVPVDALPVAARAAPPKGKLSIAASPGWCSVSVDGAGLGVTPLASVELAVGTHRVDCVPPTGKARAVKVTISEGATTRHKFSLDE
jgi:serine/threonine-protein kinase